MKHILDKMRKKEVADYVTKAYLAIEGEETAADAAAHLAVAEFVLEHRFKAQGLYKRASGCAKTAVDVYTALSKEDKALLPHVAKAKKVLGDVYLAYYRPDKSKTCYLEALEGYLPLAEKDADYTQAVAECYRYLAQSCMELHEYVMAVGAAKEALAQYKRAMRKNTELRLALAETFDLAAEVYIEAGNTDEAEACLRKAKNLYEKDDEKCGDNHKNDCELGYNTLLWGRLAFARSGRGIDAFRPQLAAHDIANSLHDRLGCLLLDAKHYYDAGMMDLAEDNYGAADAMFEHGVETLLDATDINVDVTKELAVGCMYWAESLWGEEEPQKARHAAERSEMLFRDILHDVDDAYLPEMAACYRLMGRFAEESEQHADALTYYEKAAKLDRHYYCFATVTVRDNLMKDYYAMAKVCHQRLGDLETAREYYQKTLDYARECGDKYADLEREIESVLLAGK